MSEFDINSVTNMINKNNDNVISTKEISKFLKTQKSESVFTKYLTSINEDIDVNEFITNAKTIIEQSGEEPVLDFKKKKYEKRYEKRYEEVEKKRFAEERQECYRLFGYKAQNKKEFDKLFDEFSKECQQQHTGSIYSKFKALELTQPPTIEFIKESGLFDLCLPIDKALPDIDWSEHREIFDYLSFGEGTFANTLKEHLPEGYDPQTVFENGKSIGLGIDRAHASGYTGKGISYAIIDSGVAPHNDLNYKEYTLSQYADPEDNISMHGSAVSYIAKEIAPDADCYYYATDFNNGGDEDKTVLDSLKSILEKNKTLPDDQKIRFVSMSMPLYGGEEAQEVVKELEAQGVWVYYSGCEEDENMGYLSKIDPMGDPDDFDNYQIALDGADMLYVNSGSRTVPDPSGENAYRHDSRASQSWSIPVIAGYYTLACQADPSMTKEKFMALAEETAQVKQSKLPILEKTGEDSVIVLGRTEETVAIKIIDINALLEKIETMKT